MSWVFDTGRLQYITALISQKGMESANIRQVLMQLQQAGSELSLRQGLIGTPENFQAQAQLNALVQLSGTLEVRLKDIETTIQSAQAEAQQLEKTIQKSIQTSVGFQLLG